MLFLILLQIIHSRLQKLNRPQRYGYRKLKFKQGKIVAGDLQIFYFKKKIAQTQRQLTYK